MRYKGKNKWKVAKKGKTEHRKRGVKGKIKEQKGRKIAKKK